MTTKPISHLPSRLFFLFLLGAIGTFEIIHSVSTSTQQLGLFLSGLGVLLLGLSSFFQPVILSSSLHGLLAASQAAVIGSTKLRYSLNFGGVACLFIGLFLRHVLQA
jgi:hypothetical protein